jgi:hypothetical protein
LGIKLFGHLIWKGSVMKKLLLALGAAIGFIFGSRAGRRPYEQIESKVKKLTGRSSVHDVVSSTKDAMHHATDAASSTIGHKVDDAAHHVSDAIDKSADKVTEALGSDR